VALLAVLSLTPGDYMLRTAVPGDFEHFAAYLGTSVIASLGYARRLGYLPLLCCFVLLRVFWKKRRTGGYFSCGVGTRQSAIRARGTENDFSHTRE
jgi:hypothetical protein